MNRPTEIDILFVEDSPADCELVLRHLRQRGWEPDYERVETPDAMREALAERTFDLVLSDWSMPKFSAPLALEILRASEQDLPFIIISGTIGEDTAVAALRAGAHDFLRKDKLARLNPSIERELREAENRRARRRSEEALQATEERFRRLVQSMDEHVFTLDLEHCIDGIFGRDRTPPLDDPVGKRLSEIFDGPEDKHRAAVDTALEGQTHAYATHAMTPDGRRDFRISLSPLQDTKEEIIGVVGVGRDVTEIHQLRDQLTVADRLASIGMMAAGIAHEINNPLSALLANAELCQMVLEDWKQDRDDLSGFEEFEQQLEDIVHAVTHLRKIAGDVQLFARSDSDANDSVDLTDVLRTAARLARKEIASRARLVLELDEVPRVQGSESRLSQVFLNLLVNAAQAIREGDPSENEIRLVSYIDDSGQVVVEVSDTGVGMTDEVRQHIFDPFFTTKPPGEGTGIGLAICQRLVQESGGELDVESSVGEGATFRIALQPAPASA